MSVTEETKVTKPVWGTVMFIVSVNVMLFGLRLPLELVVILTILVNLGMIATGRGAIVIGIWTGVAVVVRAIIFWLLTALLGSVLAFLLLPTSIVWVLFNTLVVNADHVELANAFVDSVRWIFMTQQAKASREKRQAAVFAKQEAVSRRTSAVYVRLLELAKNQADDAILASWLNNIMAVGAIDSRDYVWFERAATAGRSTKWQYNIAAMFGKATKSQQAPASYVAPQAPALPAFNPVAEFNFNQPQMPAAQPQSMGNGFPAMPSPAAQYAAPAFDAHATQPMFSMPVPPQMPPQMPQNQYSMQMPVYQQPANGAYYQQPAQPSKKEKRQQLLSSVMPYVPSYWDGRNEIQPPAHFGDAERGVFWDLVYKQPYGATYKQWKAQMGQVWKTQQPYRTGY